MKLAATVSIKVNLWLTGNSADRSQPVRFDS
jgi:hypothetical protein